MPTPQAISRHSRIATLIAITAAVLTLSAASPTSAQTWNETGDAGSLISTAQTTLGSGTLTAIDGNLSSSTDVDVYCIKMLSVPPAGLPLFQLQCIVNNGPNVWLFDATGKGVFTNSTCSANSKTILAPNVSLATGTYYVAVSYTGLNPQASAGAIWNTAITTQHAPDGPGAAGSLTGWAGTPIVQPINPYHLAMAFMSYCDAATPAVRSTWGSLKIRY